MNPNSEEFQENVQIVLIRLMTMSTVDMLVAGLISGDESLELSCMEHLRELGQLKMEMYRDGSLEKELKAVEDVVDFLMKVE